MRRRRPRPEAWRAHPESRTPDGDLTIREACAIAMAEEMRRDPRRVHHGEEVRNIQGLQVSQVCAGIRRQRVIDTPITEHGLPHRLWRGMPLESRSSNS